VEILAEEAIDGSMVGVDLEFNGTRFLDLGGISLESYRSSTIQKWGTVGMFRSVIDRLQPYLKEQGYRGAFSMEGMWDGVNLYITDYTTRFAYPMASVFSRYFNNFPEVIYKVAKGEDVDIDISNQYSGIAMVSSEQSLENWLPFKISDNNVFKDVALKFTTKKGGKYYTVPMGQFKDTEVYGVMDSDDSVKEVMDNILEKSKKISLLGASQVDIVGVIRSWKELIEELNARGVPF
jgi:hypothetical protein